MGTIGNFDTDADALARRIAAHDDFGKKDLNDWCFESLGIAEGMRVLDLGCGTGNQSVRLAKLGCEVTAVDASANALAMLSRQAASQGIDSIETVESFLDDVPVAVSGEFDRAISAYAIYYAKEPLPLFKAVHSMLVPGGAFFFCGPAFDNNMEMKAFLTSIGQQFTPGAAPFMEELGPAIARQLFASVELSKFENPVTFTSPEQMWEYWSSHNMFDASVEERFRDKAAEHFRDNDIFTMTKRVRGVLARR